MSERYYELLENAPDYAKETAALIRWSENYDFPSPASLFLDLIGYSADQYGEVLCSDLGEVSARLGYLECDMLADALKEYAARPQDITAWLEELFAAESEGGQQ